MLSFAHINIDFFGRHRPLQKVTFLLVEGEHEQTSKGSKLRSYSMAKVYESMSMAGVDSMVAVPTPFWESWG